MSERRTAILTRNSTGDEGTFGIIETDSGYNCFSLELPWKNNIQGKSCIPAGTYLVSWRDSPKHGMCYHVNAVPGRTDIEIHSANWAGDVDKGLICELLGCIAPGRAIAIVSGQKGVTNSKIALKELENDFSGDFELTILWKEGVKYE